MFNECKSWRPATTAPQSEGAAFAQKGKSEGTNKHWGVDKTCPIKCSDRRATSSPTVLSSIRKKTKRTSMTKMNLIMTLRSNQPPRRKRIKKRK